MAMPMNRVVFMPVEAKAPLEVGSFVESPINCVLTTLVDGARVVVVAALGSSPLTFAVGIVMIVTLEFAFALGAVVDVVVGATVLVVAVDDFASSSIIGSCMPVAESAAYAVAGVIRKLVPTRAPAMAARPKKCRKACKTFSPREKESVYKES
jgi:hypothetical protein